MKYNSKCSHTNCICCLILFRTLSFPTLQIFFGKLRGGQTYFKIYIYLKKEEEEKVYKLQILKKHEVVNFTQCDVMCTEYLWVGAIFSLNHLALRFIS